MFTRLWQHRYHGLLATLLVGLAAAVIVMLLPDRQHAFARFMVDPAIADGQLGSQSLIDDQRVVNRVLQRLDVESPSLIDPRQVDPVTAFKQNFGLRPTGTPGEFEISYVSRSSEQAAEGVKAWLAAASDVWRLDGTDSRATPLTPTDSVQPLLAQIESARSALNETRDRQQDLLRQQSALTARLTRAQSAKRRFETERLRAETALAAARQARQVQQARQLSASTQASAAATAELVQARTELERAEQAAAAARDALAKASANAEQSALQLAQVRQEQTLARQAVASAQAALRSAEASKTDFAQTDVNSAANIALARAARLDRQRDTIQAELKRIAERRQALQRELDQTPSTIVEVVTEKAPLARPTDNASRRALIRQTRAELSELRIRFTDNHPDVRRQLAILADLESPGADSSVSQAPTVGARPEVRPNPRFVTLQQSIEQNEQQSAQLSERLLEMQTERAQLASQRETPSPDNTDQARRAQIDQAQRVLRAAQAASRQAQAAVRQALSTDTKARTAQRDATNGLESAQRAVESRRAQLARAQQAVQAARLTEPADVQAQSDAVPEPTDAQLAEVAKERQSLEQELRQAEQSLTSVGLALEQAEQQSRQQTAALTALESQADQAATKSQSSVSGESGPSGMAIGGLTVVQTPQVVPAASNPDRSRWLLLGLLGSLLLGAAVASLLALRRTTFSSISELEQVTGLRALGGVPRFSSSRQILGFWLSAVLFLALIMLYGLAYLAFIALVDSGSGLSAPDWAAWREAGLALLRDGAVRVGLSEQWLAGLAGD